ncbi:hypothetical protein L6R29_01640 [Myxococcota bacterium]|nr:hypothetical protein [Myxococcota bacterium]
MRNQWLTLIGLGCLGLFAACEKKEPDHLWLRGNATQRILTLAKHHRGNDVVMMEVRYRHEQLYLAIQSKNTNYAMYQLNKIENVMRHGAERRPKRKKSYDWFFQTALPPMKASLEKKYQPDIAFQQFTAQCMACHIKEKLPYIPVPQPWEKRRLPP